MQFRGVEQGIGAAYWCVEARKDCLQSSTYPILRSLKWLRLWGECSPKWLRFFEG